jgi:Cytochrome c, mono- and diheme variants
LADRKKWLSVLLLLAIGLTACGGGGGAGGARQEAGSGAGQAGAEGAVQAGDEGERLYMNRCMACHGGELEGGFGPELRNAGERMGREELIAVIRDGKGAMPAFKDRLTDEEIAAIVDWIHKQ